MSLLLLLQTRGQLTAADLAERLDVSERTIQRDAEALAEAGVPIEALRGPAGGYRLAGGYRTRLTGLTTEEAETTPAGEEFASPPLEAAPQPVRTTYRLPAGPSAHRVRSRGAPPD